MQGKLASADMPDAPYRQKKPSHHLLIREIKRLRAENTSLRSSVSVLQSDLRNQSQSRQATDETHKKIYDDMLDRNNKLELDLMDKEDEIDLLKQKIDHLELRLMEKTDNNMTLHLKRNSFGCYDIDDDHEMCQPSTQESALPDLNNYSFRQEMSDSDEEDTCNELPEPEPFEELVPSYIHQALLSKLSSARVRLELDDMIVKYEATPDSLFKALATSFIDWIGSVLKQQPAEMTPSKLFMTKIQSGIAGFWQEILSYFARDNDGQYNLLHDIEENIQQNEEGSKKGWRKTIADHFDHLILMLYKHHIIDDEAVVSWWNQPFNNGVSKKIRNMTHRFVEWIEDSEEEDEDDSDDDEDEKEEEDKKQDQVQDKTQEEEDEEEDDYVDHFDDEEFDDMDIIMSPPHTDDPSTSGDDTDNGFEHADMLDQHSLHTMLNDLLIDNDDSCICQFNNAITELGPPFQDELQKCSCDYTPTTPVTEKKKKTVRIAM